MAEQGTTWRRAVRGAALLGAATLLLTAFTSDEPRPTTTPEVPVDSSATSAPPAREPRWDPRDVDELPAAGPEVAPGLPERVSPPEHATLLSESPMEAAVLTVDRRGRRVQLLGVDGSWREVRPAERYGREALSRDGTRLAVLLNDRIELWHLPTGRRTEVALPDRFRPWDYSRVAWVDASTLLLDDRAGGWAVDISTGAAQRTPFPQRFSWTVDSDGHVLEATDPSRPPAVIDWTGGSARRTGLAQVGTPLQVVANRDVVAGTVYGGNAGFFAAFVLDRDDPAAVRTLQMRDFDANYSNWGLRTVQALADGSVLIWVAVPGRRAEVDGWRLVRWDPTTDHLEIVTTSEADPTWSMTFAADLLEDRPHRDGTGTRFDPRTVDALPAARPEVARLLPAVVEAPSSSPALADRPIEAAVLSIGGDDATHVLSVDGEWRSVPLPAVAGSVALTRDGTRLAVQFAHGVDVWDLPTGIRTRLPAPPGHRGSSDASWTWLDRDTLMLDGLGPGWLVDAGTGAARRVPYPRGPWTVDDQGAVIETDWDDTLTDWATGEPRRLDMSHTGRLQMFQASTDTIVGTSVSPIGLAVQVVERSDLSPRHILRIRDDGQTTYGNGGLSIQALLADGTVLLRVLVDPGPRASIRFVAWDPESDDLRLVTRTRGVLPAWSVATGLLG